MLVSPGYCATMARYNLWQNRSLIEAANGLVEAERSADRGAFWRSISGTLSHVLWGDGMWMSRFDNWDKPILPIRESVRFAGDWETYKGRRATADTRIIAWAGRLTEEELQGDLTWYSGALERDVTKPLGLCVAHFFNHQTHHRGQVHAMLTAAGTSPEATDLFVMPEEIGI